MYPLKETCSSRMYYKDGLLESRTLYYANKNFSYLCQTTHSHFQSLFQQTDHLSCFIYIIANLFKNPKRWLLLCTLERGTWKLFKKNQVTCLRGSTVYRLVMTWKPILFSPTGLTMPYPPNTAGWVSWEYGNKHFGGCTTDVEIPHRRRWNSLDN